MVKREDKTDYDSNTLKTFITNEVIKKAQKIKNKWLPISERTNEDTKILKIKTFYNLEKHYKNIFFILVKNTEKQKKIRYFLAVLLASQSSDLLVYLANDLMTKNSDLKLIQYSIYPNNSRVSLLSLIELKKVENFDLSINFLLNIRKEFRDMLNKLKNLLENR